MANTIDEGELRRWVVEFFKKADASAPVTWFLPYLAEKFHMFWTPTCQFDGHDGFAEFYRNTTGNMFNRVHEVNDVAVNMAPSRDACEVTFRIHETLNIWRPPMAKPIDAEINATFRWTMRVSPTTGIPVIVDYALTSVNFPATSIIVEADKVFKDPVFLQGPFSIP